MRPAAIAIALALPLSGLRAGVSYNAAFDSTIPSAVKCENLDGGKLQTDVYRNMQESVSWCYGKVSLYNGAAVCPTRNADGTVRRSRMVMPAVTVADADALLRWDARSMLQQVAESYRVLLRTADGGEWSELCHVEGETYGWTTHALSLSAYVGCDVQVAFETATTSPDAFMLAIDDVAIGTMRDIKYAFVADVPHYVTPDDDVVIGGRLTNYGSDNQLRKLQVVVGDAVAAEVELGIMVPLQEVEIEARVRMTAGEVLDYAIYGIGGDGSKVSLGGDFISCSHFSRTLLMDHYTGVWCNNCTKMALTANAQQRRFGNEVIITEPHVRDAMFCGEYWEGYGSDCIYAIPQMLVNHNRGTVAETKDYYVTLEAELRAETIAGIAATMQREAGGQVRLTSECCFSKDMDNAGDRYRVGYILLTDIHRPGDMDYSQQNSAWNAEWEEYYFLPARIMPEMTYFHNVVVEGSTGVAGIAGSIDARISAFTPMGSTCALMLPDAYTAADVKAVAMIIDNSDGRIVNCCLAVDETDDIRPVKAYSQGAVYDLSGRKAARGKRGLYVRDGKKILITH